jgi:hypothetical protein
MKAKPYSDNNEDTLTSIKKTDQALQQLDKIKELLGLLVSNETSLHNDNTVNENEGKKLEKHSETSRTRRAAAALVFMSSRTGSSLLTDLLNLHPEILFMPEQFNHAEAWTLPKANNMSDVELFLTTDDYKRVYTAEATGKEYSAPAKNFDAVKTVGFKTRVLDAGLMPGSEQWNTLLRIKPKVVCSYRRNQIKAAISEFRAHALYKQCQDVNVKLDHNCTVASDWKISGNELVHEFLRRSKVAKDFFNVCLATAQHLNVYFLAYEDFIADIPGNMESVLRFMDFPVESRQPYIDSLLDGSLNPAFAKNTPDNLTKVLNNMPELQEAVAKLFGNWGASMLLSTTNPPLPLLMDSE